jgi:bifunctional DNA-binding transcriptional regulator/antitoxin component of YhaV-PrlF toxin-antitoxin module
MEVPVTTRLENGTITVPPELLEKAGIHDGDELYVEVASTAR